MRAILIVAAVTAGAALCVLIGMLYEATRTGGSMDLRAELCGQPAVQR